MNEIEKTEKAVLPTKLKGMLQKVNVLKQSFGRSGSQWMEANMAIFAQTPLRNIHQLLARIEKATQACKHNEYKLKKTQVKLETKKEQREKCKDKFKIKLLDIEIDEIEYGLDAAMLYFNAAVKNIQHNYDCIQQIMKSKGWTSFDEMDFEKEEEEHHVKTALNQSIRSVQHKGSIDEGNQEYLEQCGIDPYYVERIIKGRLIRLSTLKMNALDKTTDSFYTFIDDLYKEFKGQSKKRLEKLGVKEPFLEKVMFQVSEDELKLLSIDN